MTDTTTDPRDRRIADLEAELAVAGIDIDPKFREAAHALAKTRAADGKSRGDVQEELTELFGAGSANGTGETPSWEGKKYSEMSLKEKISYNRAKYGQDEG